MITSGAISSNLTTPAFSTIGMSSAILVFKEGYTFEHFSSDKFDKYAADNTAFTDPGGMSVNKAQLMAMFKSGELKIESSKIDDMKVQMFGNTAIVAYRTTDKGKFKTQVIDGQFRWTDTFVKMGGKWMMVATQGTPITQQ